MLQIKEIVGACLPAVVDTQGYKIDIFTLHTAGLDGRVLPFKVASELRPIMPSVGFGEYPEVAILVLGELCVEGLQ